MPGIDTYGEFVWGVCTYECSPDGLCTLATLCNYFQEAASLNAAALGFSKADIAAAGEDLTWVMTHLRVRVVRYPAWGENVRVLTFPRAARRISASRDFFATDSEGREIARATSEWLVIDMASRRPKSVPPFVSGKANTVREPVFGPDAQPARLRWPQDAPAAATPAFRTVALNADIDMNAHVNNVRYIVWLAEMAPAGKKCRDLELVFRSETHAGDTVLGETLVQADGSLLQRLAAPDGREHVVARSVWQ